MEANIYSKMLSFLTKNHNYTEVEKEKILFSLKTIVNDFSKSFLLFIIFSILGYTKFYLVAFISSLLIRVNIGGFHLKSYLGCLAFSSLYYTVLFTLNKAPIPSMLVVILLIFSLIVQFAFSPVVSKQRESIKYKNIAIDKRNAKIRGLLLSTGILVLYIVKDSPMTNLMMWVVILLSTEIIIYKGVKYYEINRNSNRSYL